WIAKNVELGTGRDVADAIDSSTHDDQSAHLRGERRIAGQSPGNIRERSQAEDGYFAGCGPNFVADELLGRMLPGQLRYLEAGVAQSVIAVNVTGIHAGKLIGSGGGPNPRIARRIEPLDESLDVQRRPLRRHISRHRRYRDHFEPRVEEGHREGDGIVDAGIAV